MIHQNNTRRVVRALEMLDEGVPYAEQRVGFSTRKSVYDTVFVGLTMDRERLYGLIDARVDAMVEAGLLEEIERLLDAGLRATLTASQAIGYKEFVPVVEGKADLDEAVAAVKQATRRYAKRQLTWFRADPRSDVDRDRPAVHRASCDSCPHCARLCHSALGSAPPPIRPRDQE